MYDIAADDFSHLEHDIILPNLVLRDPDDKLPDKPLWTIRSKVDRTKHFKEDAMFAQDTVQKELAAQMLMFAETMDWMPVAVALRFENGQYIHCNSAW